MKTLPAFLVLTLSGCSPPSPSDGGGSAVHPVASGKTPFPEEAREEGVMDRMPAGELRSPDGTVRAVVAEGGELTLRRGDEILPISRNVLPELSFSADGRRLAYPQLTPHTDADVFVTEVATATSRQITDWPSAEDRPVLSPDGKRLAFVSGRTGIASIWVLDVDAGQSSAVQVTNVGLESKEHAPGVPPEGFVPVPDGLDLEWTPRGLRWTAAHRVFEAEVP